MTGETVVGGSWGTPKNVATSTSWIEMLKAESSFPIQSLPDFAERTSCAIVVEVEAEL
jgi:hypothetical protein